jgi:hypothetical protein
MKTRSFTVTEWPIDTIRTSIDNTDAIDIDWPRVQREAGRDHVEWLLKQDHAQCQIMLEFDAIKQSQRLIAEFYDEALAVNYALLWAK